MRITDFCAEVHNWFDVRRVFGSFVIKNGSLQVDGLLEGQYFRIIGSIFNDGVYQYPTSELQDETFNGAVWYMAIPPDVTQLINDMTEWEDQNAATLNSPYSSESFGGYSYTKASGNASNGGDGGVTAFSHFADKLKRWRKARDV